MFIKKRKSLEKELEGGEKTITTKTTTRTYGCSIKSKDLIKFVLSVAFCIMILLGCIVAFGVVVSYIKPLFN